MALPGFPQLPPGGLSVTLIDNRTLCPFLLVFVLGVGIGVGATWLVWVWLDVRRRTRELDVRERALQQRPPRSVVWDLESL